MDQEIEGLIQYEVDKYYYKSWKIHLQVNGVWESIRIRPTEWFIASSLKLAIKTIDRYEEQRTRGIRLNPMERKQRLMDFLKKKKLKQEKK